MAQAQIESLQYVIFCCIIPNYQVLDVNNKHRLRQRILNVGACYGRFRGGHFPEAMLALIRTIQRNQGRSLPMFSKKTIVSRLKQSYGRMIKHEEPHHVHGKPNSILGRGETHSLALLDLRSRSTIG